MAISAPTQLVHDHVVASGSTFANTAANYTSGRLYIVAVGGSGTTGRTASSLSGAGATWTEVNSGTDSSWTDGVAWAVTIFTSTNASGTSQSLTVTYSGSWASTKFMHVFEVTSGFDTSGLVVQAVANNAAAGSSPVTIALADSAASGNMRLGYFVHRVQDALSSANAGTMVGVQTIASPASSKGLWYYDGDTTTDPSVSFADTSRGVGYMGIEIKATAGSAQALAGTSAVTFGQTADTVVSHALTAASAVTFGQTGDTTVAHTLTATSAVTFGQTADTVVAHSLAATSAVIFAQTADTSVTHPLAATSAVTFGQSADTTVAHSLAATSAVAFGQSADAAVAHPLAATSAVTFGQSADVTTGKLLTGNADISFAQISAVTVAHALAATSAVVFGQTADLSAGVVATAPALRATAEKEQHHGTHREHNRGTVADEGRSAHRTHTTATHREKNG